jgi:hypothetical protein
MSKKSSLLLVGLLITLPLTAAAGKDKGHEGKGGSKSHQPVASPFSAAVDIDIVLGEYRRVVRDYLDHYPGGGLPPGLAKRGGDLPPGLEKQLRKNARLPPGLQKRLAPYPTDLKHRLPPLKEGYDGGFLHSRVVIFNRNTSAVFEVFIP